MIREVSDLLEFGTFAKGKEAVRDGRNTPFSRSSDR